MLGLWECGFPFKEKRIHIPLALGKLFSFEGQKIPMLCFMTM
jgi:hypothetical protein